jgi:pSer/pThr/pTyr-binding forkhead associated (FHA) protein
MIKVFIEQIKGNEPGKLYEVKQGTTSIGRKNTSIILDSSRISVEHAEIHFSGNRVFIMDHNSTNGTYVNGIRVDRIALKDGDVISLGGVGEKASVVFKVTISGNTRKTVYILKKKIEVDPKPIVLFLAFFVFSLLVWFSIPVDEQKLDSSRNWLKAQEMLPVDISEGEIVTLFLNDSVVLPNLSGQWKKEISYKKDTSTTTFEDRIYVADLWNLNEKSKVSEKIIVSSFMIQRFKKDFLGNVDAEVIRNFKWHENYFLKENNIDQEFNYSVGKLCVWQWLIWNIEGNSNLYATCITQRGRFIVQASSLDPYLLKKFFVFIATTYKEGKLDN